MHVEKTAWSKMILPWICQRIYTSEGQKNEESDIYVAIQ